MDNIDVLKIKRLADDAIIPYRANEFDAGLDLFSNQDCVLSAGEFKAISTGICIELPQNTEAQIRPRSGLALKHGITVLNSPGTIDQGYRGEIKVILINHSKTSYKISKGDKIAQMVIAKILTPKISITDTLSNSQRGDSGFGSSDK